MFSSRQGNNDSCNASKIVNGFWHIQDRMKSRKLKDNPTYILFSTSLCRLLVDPYCHQQFMPEIKKNIRALAKFLYGMIKRKFNRAAVRKIWTKISRISINVFLQKLLVAARYQVAWIFKHVQIGSKWPFKFDITTRYDTPPKQVEYRADIGPLCP